MAYNFFLYGVYDEGQKCFARFQNLIASSRPAFARGSLFKLSCGLPLLAPMGENIIPGRLVELNIEDSHWPIIDALNGYNFMNAKKSLIWRQTIEVMVPEAENVKAQTYGCNPEKKIQGSREFMNSEYSTMTNQSQSVVDRLTERQKTYIQKLSQAKGREIVPVDMGLYRELMSLELIVDKGRRLALTNLGHEVSLFL